MNMTSRYILFDVDGTLINTWDLYMEVYWRTLQRFNGNHITKEFVLASKPTSELHFIKKHIGPEMLDEAHTVMMDLYEELHDTMFGGVYAGVREMLGEVRRSGAVTGVVTGKSTRAWEITTSKINIGDFDVTIVDDDVELPKPAPEGILAALRKVNASPAECVYIGDTISDYKAAQDAGVRSITALWAKSNPSEKDEFVRRARDNGVREFVDHPEELIKRIV